MKNLILFLALAAFYTSNLSAQKAKVDMPPSSSSIKVPVSTKGIPPGMGDPLKKGGATQKSIGDQTVVIDQTHGLPQGEWFTLERAKMGIDKNSRYEVEVIPIGGDADLYIWKNNSEVIRKSENPDSQTERLHYELSDLNGSEDRLFLSVYGYTNTEFTIRVIAVVVRETTMPPGGGNSCFTSPTHENCSSHHDDWVCGCDDKDYRNECEARSAGIKDWRRGRCHDPCFTTPTHENCSSHHDDWVCGCDGKDYRNECEARSAGVKDWRRGRCHDPCFTTPTHENCTSHHDDWVCGCDGKDYRNECEARSAGVKDWRRGRCHDPCFTTPTHENCTSHHDDWVCGCDGKDYRNECEARSAGVKDWRRGRCHDPCFTTPTHENCTSHHDDWVCGCDGKDYRNECEARSAGVKDWRRGRCHDPCFTTPTHENCTSHHDDWVCGCDGKDYRNECEARSAGVKDWRRGRCHDPCFTTPTHENCSSHHDDWVCGCDDKDYRNECEARSAGVKDWRRGRCHDPCFTTPTHENCSSHHEDWVCGCDGKDYRNECEARSAGVKDWRRGRCHDPCFTTPSHEVCTSQHDPVCGCDGKDYGNECEARRAGVKDWKRGRCHDHCTPHITFKNTGCKHVKVYWNNNGHHEEKHTLSKNEEWSTTTVLHHKWVFKVDGHEILQHTVNSCDHKMIHIDSRGCNDHCNWDFNWRDHHSNNHSPCGQEYNKGHHLYVKCSPHHQQSIEWMELSIEGPGGNWHRKETSYPYDWGWGNGKNDERFRNLQPGSYTMTCKVRDKCGHENTKTCHFTVKGTNGNTCNWDFNWRDHHSNNHSPCGQEYNGGHHLYVKCNPHHQQSIEWMELSIEGPGGNWHRKETSYPYDWGWGNGKNDERFRNLQPGSYTMTCKVRDKCGHENTKTCHFTVKGTNGNTCNWDFNWRDHHSNNHSPCGQEYNKGHHLYVKCSPHHQQSIEWMELSIEGPGGNWHRKETSYPYDWGWGNGKNDERFRNLQPGNYTMTCKVRDKCGHENTKTCHFTVKGTNGTTCNWDFNWRDHHSNNHSPCGQEYNKGHHLYVKCSPHHQQSIEWMELSIEGPGGNWHRKETSYPYDWGWGNGKNDERFRNLQPGNYTMTCKVRDKCGHENTKTCHFTVR